MDFSTPSSSIPPLLFKKFVAPPRGAGTGSTTQVLPEYKRGQDGRTAREPAPLTDRTARRAVGGERAGGRARAGVRDGRQPERREEAATECVVLYAIDRPPPLYSMAAG